MNTALSLLLAAVVAAPLSASPSVEARIAELVTSVGEGADARNWNRVAEAFAPRVVLDYGVPELLTPEAIVARWSPLFAQLGATRHSISDVRVQPHAGGFRVEAGFTATHELAGAPGGDTWTLRGRYTWEVRPQADGALRITRLRMVPVASEGNTSLIAEAQRRAGVVPVPARITAEHVEFVSGGETLRGVVYRPAGASLDSALPALVVTGAWMTVQEQMPMAYAQRLAEQGMVAMTFDFRGFGQSEGAVRGFEDNQRKSDDIVAAVAFLGAQRGVDAGRTGVFAMCASTGYAAQAATASDRVRLLVLAAPWLQDRALIEAVYGTHLAALRERGEQARASFAAGGVAEVVPAASTVDSRAAMFEANPTWLDYYVNPARGAVSTWPNEFAVMSWASWLAFDSHVFAPAVRVPTLIVHSEAAAIPDGTRRFAATMGRAPVQVWLEGATQFDFYDKPEVLERVVAETATFLTAAAG
jgi:dienelactone hydrolase